MEWFLYDNGLRHKRVKGWNFRGTNFREFPELWLISRNLQIKLIFLDVLNFYHKFFHPAYKFNNL